MNWNPLNISEEWKKVMMKTEDRRKGKQKRNRITVSVPVEKYPKKNVAGNKEIRRRAWSGKKRNEK